MKNGDLVVLGVKADELDPASYNDAAELVRWEFAAYDAYDAKHGPGACARHGIDFLADMFSPDFQQKFDARRDFINDKSQLVELIADRVAIDQQIAELQSKIDAYA